MNPQSPQQQRVEQVIAELEKTIAEADAAVAQTRRFCENEGADLLRQLENLNPEMKAKVDAEVALMMQEVERDAERLFRHKMFEQAQSYRPRNSRRLV